MMLFPAVLMNFPNSIVCLTGEWSIGNVFISECLIFPLYDLVMSATFNYSIHDLLLQQRNAEWMNILSHDETKTGKVSHCSIP